MQNWKLFTIIGALALFGGAFVAWQTSDMTIPYQDDARLAEGEAIYATNCAACHGADLAGQPDWKVRDADGYLPAPPLDGSGHSWHHVDEQLFDLVHSGVAAMAGEGYKTRMRGFGDDLSDKEILSALAYIKSNWPARIIEAHNEMSAHP